MEGQKCFAVVGGDARQAAAARALARAGYSVGGPEMIAVADYILLPLPLDAARTVRWRWAGCCRWRRKPSPPRPG